MKTKSLVIKTKKKIFGALIGRNLSKFKGSGLDFKEFREYVYGEDSKKIDWKISAKIQKPLVKEYDEERELRIIIAVLKSGSLHFGSVMFKSELCAQVISMLSFAAMNEDNRVQPVFIGKTKKIFKPSKNTKSVYAFADYALNTKYLQEDYTQRDIEFLNSFKKSILFVIGDFFKPVDLSVLKHETYAVIIRDRFEENPKFQGNTEIVDPVTLNTVNVNFSKAAVSKLKKQISQNDTAFARHCKKHKIPFVKIYTDEEPVYKLIKLLR